MSNVHPHMPEAYGAAECRALAALSEGTATPEQQRLALSWIHHAAATYDLSYRPDSERATAFAEGKRWVGLQILKLCRPETLAAIEKAKEAK